MPHATSNARHLLGLDGMPCEEIVELLDLAEGYVRIARGGKGSLDTLAGRIIATLFFEDSTRSRCSQSIAATRLGASVIDLTSKASSLSKGETVMDTVRNIEAMGIDAMAIRASASGVPHQVAERVRCPVINAGDGSHEHPTQALLDMLTMRQHFGDVSGRHIGIVGDINNSRVARSNVFGLTSLGAIVHLIAPPALVSPDFESIAVSPGHVIVEHDVDAVLGTLDAIMMLRVQYERGTSIAGDYRKFYGLTVERASRMKTDSIILHPGPINRGLELDGQVADDPHRSVILRQVTNGVAVRMAVLVHLIPH